MARWPSAPDPSSLRLAPGGVVHGSSRVPGRSCRDTSRFAKLRAVELLLITTVPTMVLAERGWPDTWLVVVTSGGRHARRRQAPTRST
ncbi:MAG: hypothetical protein R2713_07800 [Ilumatobacteraceae bacterium]